MKFQLIKIFRIIGLTLVLFSIVSTTTLVLSGCGSSAEAEKANKKKKKKKKISLEEDEATDEEASNEADPAHESANSNDSYDSSNTNQATENGGKKSEPNAEAEKIWNNLMAGNSRFVAGKHTIPNFASERKMLASGQKPEVIVLGCADSRVPPELVFDKNLGELFVIRAAGNIADLVSLGSIEYAVEHLHSKVLVILGHESCGAVAAAVSNEEMPTKNLSAIVNKITPAFEGSNSCPLGGKPEIACVELNVKQSATDVVLNSPIIKKAISEGHLTIIRAVYQLESGKVVRQSE